MYMHDRLRLLTPPHLLPPALYSYSWKILTLRTRRQLWEESLGRYPMIHNQIKYFHSGLFVNIGVSIIKSFLPLEITSKIEMGCQFAGRLDTFYALPTRELATQRLLQRIEASLQRRYENIENFSLD